MSKIGTYEYPDTHFGTTLKAIEILISKFNGKVKNEKIYAEALGHSSNKSGAFYRKIADLRRYRLISSKGIEATDRAKLITKPLHPKERIEAVNEAIMDIKLWEALYSRIGSTIPNIQDFKLHLAEVTGDRDKSYTDAENISNLYKDAMRYYNPSAVKTVSKDSEITGNKIDIEEKPGIGEEKVPETIMLFKSGDVNITLPKTDSNIDIICNVLSGMKKQKEQK